MVNRNATLVQQHDVVITGVRADQLLRHLNQEKATLEAMLQAVRDVHHALIHLDDGELQKCLEIEARQLSSSLAIQSRRQELQGELADVLHLEPKEVTISRLVKMTSGPIREAIENIWASLIEMATEVDRLNRQNAALIGQSLSIIRGVVERLTGATGASESYTASGSRSGAHPGPILQWGA